MSIGSCGKIINEHLDDESISMDVTDSVLDIESSMKQPNLLNEEFMASDSHVKD